MAKNLLAPDGSIYVHVDFRKGHYIKIVLDELFKEFEFAEIIWVCGLMGSGKFYPKAQTIICYRGPNAIFNPPDRLGLSQRIIKALKRINKDGFTQGVEKVVEGRII